MSLYLPLFKSLNDANVQYVIVGGLATILHGYPRFTSDVDLVINLEKTEAEKAVQTLISMGLKALLPVDPFDFTDKAIRESWIEQKGMLVFSFYQPDNPLLIVDLFVREPIPFKQLSQRAVQMDIGGEMVNVCDINDLIEMKRLAARPKDIEDIKYLSEIQNNENKK